MATKSERWMYQCVFAEEVRRAVEMGAVWVSPGDLADEAIQAKETWWATRYPKYEFVEVLRRLLRTKLSQVHGPAYSWYQPNARR